MASPETSTNSMAYPGASQMPYGFGGGSVQFPGGQTATIPAAEVITNGVSWTESGPVVDQLAARTQMCGQEDC